jgi:tetratricopeptide (TPR) repeat protein
METMVLERYIQQAEQAFDQNEHLEGMRLLEEALFIDPKFAKAHNHMGWLYLHKLKDWTKAELHLNYALKFAPDLSFSYYHMAHILFEKARFGELEALLKKAMTVGGVQKSFIYNEYGRMHEVGGKLAKAVKFYKSAIRWSFEEQELITVKDNIRRCRDKRWMLWF